MLGLNSLDGLYVALKALLGKHLKQLRLKRGLSQEKLAEAIGVDRRSIKRFEDGENGPSYVHLEKLCKALDVTIRELFDFDWPGPDTG